MRTRICGPYEAVQRRASLLQQDALDQAAHDLFLVVIEAGDGRELQTTAD
ncbi:MAG: hypothetical protein LC749_10760 [Actinobacteria bacterium]|nr:hypothetical protein [Actinomycetota bacterium]